MEKKKTIETFLISRNELISVIVITILLSYAINLSTGYLMKFNYLTDVLTLILILSIFIVFTIYTYLLFKYRLRRRSEQIKFYPAFYYNKTNNRMIPIKRYPFSDRLHKNLIAAFAEVPKIENMWNKEPIDKIETNRNVIFDKPYESVKIIQECVEYILIDHLSHHLSIYNNQTNTGQFNLTTYQRKHFLNYIKTNRFLNLFSKSIDERPNFKSNGKVSENTTAIYLGDMKYEKFSIDFPKNTRMKRTGKKTFQIETDHVCINFKVNFSGLVGGFPYEFQHLYLKYKLMDKKNDVMNYCVLVEIDYNLKFNALFSKAGLEYYMWIDTYIESLENILSVDKFLDRIGWEYVVTMNHLQNYERLDLPEWYELDRETKKIIEEISKKQQSELVGNGQRGAQG